MSEDNDDVPSRLQRLSVVFGNSPEGVKLKSGVSLVPANLTPQSYEIQTSGDGAVDVVDVSRFKSVRELDKYVQRYEDDTPDDLGVGVA